MERLNERGKLAMGDMGSDIPGDPIGAGWEEDPSGTMKTLSDQAAEIARLRGELSRAAVREGEARQAIPRLKGSQDFLRFAPHIQHGIEMAEEAVNAALATPSPLSDAAQEVLEAAGEHLNVLRGKPGHSGPAFRRMADAVDRYRALLDGRTQEEG